MAFPNVVGRTEYEGPEAPVHTVPLPPGEAGDLLLIALIFMEAETATGVGAPGWDIEVQEASPSSPASSFSVSKIAAGNEGNSVDITSDNSRAMAALVWRIAGAASFETAPSPLVSQNKVVPVERLTPSWGADKTLWIPFLGATGHTVSGIDNWPNQTTNQRSIVRDSDPTSGIAAGAEREFETDSWKPTDYEFATLSPFRAWSVLYGIQPAQVVGYEGFGAVNI